jgi:hypothetical protein
MHDRDYTKACLERWAKWLYGANVGEISLTGRLMAGVRANVCPNWVEDMLAQRAHDAFCPLCGGKGRLKMELRAQRRARPVPCSICDPDGKFMGDWCWRCHGTRVVEIVELPINPAGIHGTRHVGAKDIGDPVCTAIDDLVASWREADATIWWHRVITFEYTRNGTQPMKAERLHISLSFYEKRLREAHDCVDTMIFEKEL